MISAYFLGANTRHGFRSLYDNFPPNGSLHIIKGCPGNGKSSFMRAIADAAEANGLSVERIYCSGDPDSLDGIYLPERSEAWVDGTAPHTVEPRFFLAQADYVCLSAFCRRPSASEATEIREHTESYQKEYALAYHALSVCGEMNDALFTLRPEENAPKLKALLHSILSAQPVRSPTDGSERSVFLRAICARGIYTLPGVLSEYKSVVRFDSLCLRDRDALKLLSAMLDEGEDRILVYDPLDPVHLDAVLLPSRSLAFCSSDFPAENAEVISLDAELSPEASAFASIGEIAQHTALQHLQCAKKEHDLLEKVLHPLVDFEALQIYTKHSATAVLQ